MPGSESSVALGAGSFPFPRSRIAPTRRAVSLKYCISSALSDRPPVVVSLSPALRVYSFVGGGVSDPPVFCATITRRTHPVHVEPVQSLRRTESNHSPLLPSTKGRSPSSPRLQSRSSTPISPSTPPHPNPTCDRQPLTFSVRCLSSPLPWKAQPIGRTRNSSGRRRKGGSMVQPLSESRFDSDVSNSEEALASILDWSYARPTWQRDALRRLCVTGELDERDLSELTDLCKRNGRGSRPLESTHIPDPGSAASTVRLRRISGVANVNALKPGEELSFNTNGLTVIYGDNGSGKSGYARVLKKACRSRSKSEERILPNIYAEEVGSSSATIDYKIDSQNHCQEWTADDEHATALLSVSVFDSSTASVHVDELNDVAYKPFPMRLLEDLADVCGDVGRRLREEIESLEQQRLEFIANPPCHSGTAVHQLIANLDSRTSESSVRSLAQLTAQDRLRLSTLESDLAGDTTAVVAQLDATRGRLEGIGERLIGLESAVSSSSVANLCQLYQEYVTARKASRVAAKISFGSEPLSGVGYGRLAHALGGSAKVL